MKVERLLNYLRENMIRYVLMIWSSTVTINYVSNFMIHRVGDMLWVYFPDYFDIVQQYLEKYCIFVCVCVCVLVLIKVSLHEIIIQTSEANLNIKLTKLILFKMPQSFYVLQIASFCLNLNSNKIVLLMLSPLIFSKFKAS